MKAWTTATIDGSCAHSYAHPIRKGDRVVQVQGATWIKLYCGPCGRQVHGMPEDTGEVLDVTDAPGCPAVLKPADPDAPLFERPFEDDTPLRLPKVDTSKPLPFDGRAAAARNDE